MIVLENTMPLGGWSCFKCNNAKSNELACNSCGFDHSTKQFSAGYARYDKLRIDYDSTLIRLLNKYGNHMLALESFLSLNNLDLLKKTSYWGLFRYDFNDNRYIVVNENERNDVNDGITKRFFTNEEIGLNLIDTVFIGNDIFLIYTMTK